MSTSPSPASPTEREAQRIIQKKMPYALLRNKIYGIASNDTPSHTTIMEHVQYLDSRDIEQIREGVRAGNIEDMLELSLRCVFRYNILSNSDD